MRGKRILISAAIALAAIISVALVLRHRRPAAPLPGRSAAAAVIATSDVTFSGNIRPQHLTGVPVPQGIDGNIEAFLVDVGQEVYEGQVLARLGAAGLEHARDTASNAFERAQEQERQAEAAVHAAMLEASRADANLQRSRMAFDRADKSLSRQKTLLAAGATPRLTYQRVEQEYNDAETEFNILDKAARAAREEVQSLNQGLASARNALADRTRDLENAQGAIAASEVRAPVDGTVAARHGEIGKPAAEAGPDLFQIATDLYALEVPLEAPPETVKRLRPGQQALVVIPDLDSEGVVGEIKSIQGSEVVVEFANNAPAVRPGMRASVRLKLD